MQHRRERWLRAETHRITKYSLDRVGHCMEVDVVQRLLVVKDELIQFMRDREHKMKVVRRQDALAHRINPLRRLASLALWTVSVTT